MTAQGAAAILNRSDRQLRTYTTQGRLRTRRRGPGGRVEYHAGDVYRLAAELDPSATPPRVEIAEIVPSSQLARRVEELTNALLDAQSRAERAETALRLLPPPEDAAAWRAERDAARAEVAALRELLAQMKGSSRALVWISIALALVAVLAVAAVVVLALVR